jgi:hypothetical protein
MPKRTILRAYVEPEEDVDANDKGPCMLQSKVEEAIQEMRLRKLKSMIMYLGMYSDFGGKMVSV